MADHSVRTHDPFGVGRVQVDRAIEGTRPILHAGVVMRMRDRDRLEAAQRTNQRFGRLVQQRDTVPQHVTLGGPQQQRALADSESRLGMDFEQIRLQPPPGIGVPGRKLRRRRPNLSAWRHELPLIPADRATGRRLRRIRIGGPASVADLDRHRAFLARWYLLSEVRDPARHIRKRTSGSKGYWQAYDAGAAFSILKFLLELAGVMQAASSQAAWR